MRWTPRKLAQEVSPVARDLRGLVRRMIVRFTDGVLWQLTGHRFADHTETVEAEVFSGIGFYSRPRAGSKTAEAILERIGDAQHVVVVATRDEELRALWKAILDANPDLAAMFNSLAGVIVKGATVEARTIEGEAKSLAFAEKLQALADDFYAHVHAASGAPTTKPIPDFDPISDPVPDPMTSPGFDGTEVLKGE